MDYMLRKDQRWV